MVGAELVEFVLGLDAGGTKTVCAVVDMDGNLIGYGRGGPTNTNFVDSQTAASSVRAAVCEALLPLVGGALAGGGSGQKPSPLVACVAGPVPGEIARAAVEEFALPRRMHFTGEAQVALAGGSTSAWGMVILSGTGSFVWLRSEDGRGHIAGGWGTALGDEGSGYWIGIEALKACMRGHDGRGPRTALTEAILSYLGLGNIHQIVSEVYKGRLRERDKVADLSRVVADVASRGDEVAVGIFRRAAEELVTAADACVRALGMEREPFVCVLSGGVFAAGDLIVLPLARMLTERFPAIQVVTRYVDQVVGCCVIALREAGVDVDEALLAKLQDEVACARAGYLPVRA